MRPLDFLKALGVAVLTVVIMGLAIFSTGAFYRYVIEPGHPPQFYIDAIQWIVRWCSYIVEPLVFFTLNFWLARRSPERNALLFAVASIVLYDSINIGTLLLFGLDLLDAVTRTMNLSLGGTLIAALLGAYLGARSRRPYQRSSVDLREGRVAPASIFDVYVYYSDDLDISEKGEEFAAKVYQSVNPTMTKAFLQQHLAPRFAARGIPESAITDPKVILDNFASQLPDRACALLQPVNTTLAAAGDVLVLSLARIQSLVENEDTIVLMAREIQPADAT